MLDFDIENWIEINSGRSGSTAQDRFNHRSRLVIYSLGFKCPVVCSA